ncbi:MAG TPA: transglycosylase domain-containing protein [Vicinamibacterales bacterium]|nr:transglycosylase domain-containing protein [Vicinamibacterales bacterium]
MPFDRKKAFFGVVVAGAAGVILLPLAIFFVGLSVGPPLPAPVKMAVPPLLADAIWARADGGTATELTPLTHVSVAKFLACVAMEDFNDTTRGDAQRVSACRAYMPALLGIEYLSAEHMRESNLEAGFREGLGRLSTTVWITHAWTKADFINTVAERGEFGEGIRGFEHASRHYFGRPPAELTLPQAALMAAFIGERRTVFDPWCGPAGAVAFRSRILQRMRDNNSIDEASFKAANVSALALGPPPADHKRCES